NDESLGRDQGDRRDASEVSVLHAWIFEVDGARPAAFRLPIPVYEERSNSHSAAAGTTRLGEASVGRDAEVPARWAALARRGQARSFADRSPAALEDGG